MTCDEKRVSDQYPELFHYTQVPTFEKIYKSRELWATHYENLNDSSELNQFRLKVAEYIAPHVRRNLDKRIQSDAQTVERVRRHGGIDALVKLEAEHWADIFHKKTFSDRWIKDTFICSFCTPDRDRKHLSTHGLLSQWRGYGKDGGVAIVLGTKDIEDRMKCEAAMFAHPINHIGDVKYDNQDAEIRNAFCKVFEHFSRMFDQSDFREGLPAEKDLPNEAVFFDHFVQGSTLVKHHAFYEEREVRLVVSPRPTGPISSFYCSDHDSKPAKAIRYGSKGNNEFRYIKLFGDAPLPITRVIVGPSRTQNANYQTISDLVAGSGIEVVPSNIPYLG